MITFVLLLYIYIYITKHLLGKERNHVRTVLQLAVASFPDNIQNVVLEHLKVQAVATVHSGNEVWTEALVVVVDGAATAAALA